MSRRTPGPDRLEKGLRLGCGAMVGVIALGPLAYYAWRPLSAGLWVGLGIGVAGFALLALRFGDAFWERLSSWWPWWP